MGVAVANGEKKSVVTSKEVFPEYYMIYVEKFQDMIDKAIDEWVYFFKYGEIKDEFAFNYSFLCNWIDVYNRPKIQLEWMICIIYFFIKY